ncbi:MAG TPA: toll/interleukin-1 receptor domain-containing protein, partial [Pyrinomonadaceae bacterium]
MNEALQQETAPEDNYKYWAFISYSHSDEEWAQWLHKSLETYRVPKKLVGRPMPLGVVPRRVFPVFRDRDELPGASDLGGNIKQALAQSRYIIVICSPKAAISKWVNEEIKGFKSLGREDRVLCLIVDGEPNAKPDSGQLECFPPAVRFRVGSDGALTSTPTEPIAADARKGKDGKTNSRLKLLSGILSVGYDELRQREKQRQFYHKLRIAAGIVAFILLATIGYVLSADANINVPGGESVRIFLDRHQASLLRPVRADAEVRRTAASERRTLLEALKRGRIKGGWLTNNLSTPEKGGDVWSHSQALFAIFNMPDASREELREFLPSLELPFTTGVAPEVKGVKYGWSGDSFQDEQGNFVKGNSENVEAVPTLWTVAAVTVALGRQGLIEGPERQRFESYLQYAQEATRVYRPLETGGWNLFPYQKDPAFHDPYSTTLALLVLLETRKDNLPWEGSTERRDHMLQATAQWLVNDFNEKSN